MRVHNFDSTVSYNKQIHCYNEGRFLSVDFGVGKMIFGVRRVVRSEVFEGGGYLYQSNNCTSSGLTVFIEERDHGKHCAT